mmetsp:Transcript_48543/g.125948  ORF Transcript_48543/g.125948 Transcript_48543/m.125948 type:complete len:448 (-) Transcript_48543:184-1527(-)
MFGTKKTKLSVLQGRSPAFDTSKFRTFDDFIQAMKKAAEWATPFPALVLSRKTVARALHTIKCQNGVESEYNSSSDFFLTEEKTNRFIRTLPRTLQRPGIERCLEEANAHFFVFGCVVAAHQAVFEGHASFAITPSGHSRMDPFKLSFDGLLPLPLEGLLPAKFPSWIQDDEEERRESFSSADLNKSGVFLSEIDSELDTMEERAGRFCSDGRSGRDQGDEVHATGSHHLPPLGVDMSTVTSCTALLGPGAEDVSAVALARSLPFLLECYSHDERSYRDNESEARFSRHYYLQQINHRIVSGQMYDDAAIFDVFVNSFLPTYYGVEGGYFSAVSPPRASPGSSVFLSEVSSAPRTKKVDASMWQSFVDVIQRSMAETIDVRQWTSAPGSLRDLASSIPYNVAESSGLEDHESFLRKHGKSTMGVTSLGCMLQTYFELLFARDPFEGE